MMNEKKPCYRIRKSRSDRITTSFCGFVCCLLLFFFLYPLLYVLIASFYSGGKISFDGYILLLNNQMVIRGFLNSVLYSFVGTIISVVLTMLSAFALSQKALKSRHILEKIFFYIPFHITGGIIATYIVVRSVGLVNTMWALILPFAIGYRNLREMKARFENGLAKELFKASALDGCGPWVFLIRIALPLLSPTVALIAFRYFVGYWGNYFYAQIFITDPSKYPLSLVLNELLIKNQAATLLPTAATPEGIHAVQMAQYALIVISSLPILLAFLIIRKKLRRSEKGGGVI